MRRLLGKRSHARRGQGLVEFALALPIFLTMTFVILDGGRLIWSYVQLSNAVQEGGRQAILAKTPGEGTVKTTVVDAGKPLTVPTGNVTVTVKGKTSGSAVGYASRAFGDRVEVKATYAFTPVVISLFGGSTSLELRALTEVMVE